MCVRKFISCGCCWVFSLLCVVVVFSGKLSWMFVVLNFLLLNYLCVFSLFFR